MGTMHVDLPQGLVDCYSFQELITGTFQIKSCNEERLPVITFFLGIIAALYHRCNYVSQDVKETGKTQKVWIYCLPKSKLTATNTSRLDLKKI